MTTNVPSTAAMLSELRVAAKLTSGALARLLGASLASISRWERGDGQPGPKHLERITNMHRRIVYGTQSAPSQHSEIFASRGVRSRIPGQGVLGENVEKTILGREPGKPILGRLKIGRVFAEGGDSSIIKMLENHRYPSATALVPFNSGISAGKNTYTYDAHTYHTKVPPQGISELISHYLPERGLILDPFSGSGMTGVAATVLGHSCILNELSPAACFISNRFTTRVSPLKFEAAVDAVLKETSALRELLYRTSCRECGKAAEILYVVWSYKVICEICSTEFVLWDACRSYGRAVREHKILSEFPCPSCSRILRKSTLKRTTAEPVLVGYKCCGSKQQEVTHVPNVEDLANFRALETSAPLAPGFFPTACLPDGVNLRQPKKHGLDSVDKFYTRRNLSALSHLWESIHRIENDEIAGEVAFVFTSLYQRVTRLSEFRFWGGSGNTARFNVPYIFNEPNVFKTFERKARTIQDHLESTASSYKGDVTVVNDSATSMNYLPDDSIDLIFTDPPFGGNINYSEMNVLWESWLGEFTDPRNEAIVNRVQNKSISDYQRLMSASLRECYRVLRSGHWMLLVFMNSSAAVWDALRTAISTSGFKIQNIQIFDKEHGTFKQFVNENAAGMDLVLHCQKRSYLDERESIKTQPAKLDGDVDSFLEGRDELLPSNVYLHVRRRREIDYRTLYSEWLAQSFSVSEKLLDFPAFRAEVQRWLARRSPV